MPSRTPTRTIALSLLLGALACVFLTLHWVHLSADFPNYSPWMDWSKYTDEGWYGDAAIRHFQLGHWYVPGDFNPAAALPVWPVLEGLLFAVTGVSLVAARALSVSVFALTVGAAWLLVWRCLRRWGSTAANSRAALTASVAALLLAASPFCYVFTRLAILEPLLVLETMLALLVAQSARPAGVPGTGVLADTRAAVRANLPVVLALGALLPLLILTKTTAVFLLPAVAWMLLAALEFRVGIWLRTGVPAAVLGAALWLAYYAGVVRPHYLLDYRYLFSANGYTGITRATAWPVLRDTVRDGMWIGRLMYPAALLCAAVALAGGRRLRTQPLPAALLLWAGGYAAFLAYHDNLQPRYYLVVAVPLILLAPVVVSGVLDRVRGAARRAMWVAAVLLFGVIVGRDARQTVRIVRHPEYTLVDAAHLVDAYITEHERDDPRHNPLVLSISGSDLSLMTGLPSICDDFGTLELADRVARYRPGWYVAWNQIDDDKMDALTPLYHLERVLAVPAMDDPDRNLLILYRLDPKEPTPVRRRRGKPTPRRLLTKMGQQPSTTQLVH